MKPFKIVNPASNWESPDRFATYEKAKARLTLLEKRFYEIPRNKNREFNRAIVHADAHFLYDRCLGWIWR